MQGDDDYYVKTSFLPTVCCSPVDSMKTTDCAAILRNLNYLHFQMLIMSCIYSAFKL